MSDVRLGSESFVDFESDADFHEDTFVDGNYDNLQFDSSYENDFDTIFDQNFDADALHDEFVFDPHIVVYDSFDPDLELPLPDPDVYGPLDTYPTQDLNDDGVPDAYHGDITAGIIESYGYEVDERVEVPVSLTGDFISDDIAGRVADSPPGGLDNTYFNASLVLHPEDSALADNFGDALDEGATISLAAGNEEFRTTNASPDLIADDDFLVTTASSHFISQSPVYIDPFVNNDPRLPDTDSTNAIYPGTLDIVEQDGLISIDGGETFLFDQDDITPTDDVDFAGANAGDVIVPPGDVEVHVGDESAGEEVRTNPEVVGRVIPFDQVVDELIDRERFEDYIAQGNDLSSSTIDGGTHYVDAQAFAENRLVIYEADDEGNLQKVPGVESAWTSYASPRGLVQHIMEDEQAHYAGYEILGTTSE